jgi:UDPglucose 6-dehydrogenase
MLHGTSDSREGPAIFIAQSLLEEHAEFVITDPQALGNARQDLAKLNGTIHYIDNPYEATKGCHAIAVMTEWDIYKRLDYKKVYENMVKPALIFDGRNILDHQLCHEIGFNVYPIGKPKMIHPHGVNSSV